ncbi:GNAT family N-acetyltransferase [Xenorhabdus sp. PB62.4]|uniref:GNAT family N-acetyltransferase n=1 Tax=Xenorhabdus sp. PB62.4 TaxID=1851573 RepID=UPI0016573384|nr:GNAT family N-acetyltransferase [Xenorhabdus sp. PB62.4]MBC8951538.1 N-acetyltransferase [Xenorhabdus sp. PB62.4]
MFRSKSFNIHQPLASGSLIRAQSFSGKWPSSVNIRASITVNEVSPEEALSAVTRVRTDMNNNGWGCLVDSESCDDEQKKWNSRFTKACGVLGSILLNATLRTKESGVSFFVAYFRGIPIGGLQLSPGDNYVPAFPKVIYLATHCGIRGCGVLLIEQAVNKSQKWGKKGNLQLDPLREAIRAYLDMGFVEIESHMELHPERNDKWIYNEATKTYRYMFS